MSTRSLKRPSMSVTVALSESCTIDTDAPIIGMPFSSTTFPDMRRDVLSETGSVIWISESLSMSISTGIAVDCAEMNMELKSSRDKNNSDDFIWMNFECRRQM